MFGSGTFLGELIKTIAGNKFYLVITTAICTSICTILLMPLIKYIVQSIWKGLKKLLTKFSRSRKFLEDYISWTIHTNKYISVLPTTMAAVKSGTLHLMELDEIYISLTMTRGADAGRSLSLEDIIRKNNRIIILGDPGAGKSTMMQYLTLRTAYNAAKVKNKQTPFLGQRIPILIRLNKFYDIKDWPPDKDLLSAMKTEIEINSGASIPEGFLEKKLKKGKCIILLDAFDELASETARQLLSEKTKNLVAQYPENQFIVTSRITGYSNQLAGAGFDNPYTIQNLTSEHIKIFIHKWYENLARLQMTEKDDSERAHKIMEYRQRANSLINVILGNDRIRQLAINPMLLSLISLVHYVKVKLPDQRHVLYGECIEILVEQWDSVKENVQIPIIERLNVKEKRQILQRIAWHMQENHLKSVSKIEVVKTILTKACVDICGEKIKEDELDQFLDIIQERTGLLIEKGFNEQGKVEISFSHLTFQEYLAALELFSKFDNEDVIFRNIVKRIEEDSEWWQEVALLALSQFKKPLEYQQKLIEIIH
ncbi:MAG: NACHT domain-containing protein [Desulfobacterales bacterium]|nr:NACHT domain-containing protein [Desulfobacterales bacterium]